MRKATSYVISPMLFIGPLELIGVLASSVSEPGLAAPQLLKSLQKAGVKDLPSNAEDEGNSHSENSGKAESMVSSPSIMKSEAADSPKAKACHGKNPSNTRKSVSFAADTKTESLLEHKSKTKIPTVKRVDPMLSLDGPSENERPRQQPVIPSNESPEDAALRRQMIQYNMSEVNNIVAEMNLDDEASDASYSDTDSEKTLDDASLDEDEDSFGRTKRRMLSDEYLAEMRALEQKLNAKALQNVGPNPTADPSTVTSSHEREEQPPMQPTTNSVQTPQKPPATKGVRFAEKLDIQPSLPPPARSPPPPTPPQSTKPIHSSKIIERPYSPTPNPTPSGPDDLDPALLQQQVKTEYNRMRNRMIQRQGGFTAQEDGAEVPLTEEEGGPRKMSRFKAARLGRERSG